MNMRLCQMFTVICTCSCIEVATAQRPSTNLPTGGFTPPSEARRQQMADRLKEYRERMISKVNLMPPATRIVIEKIDCCRTSDVRHAVRNVWNGQYSEIVSERDVTNATQRVQVMDAVRDMFDNTTQMGSSVGYHFPSHRVRFYQGTTEVLGVSISWEDNSFHIADPPGGNVCTFKSPHLLGDIPAIVPFSEFDQTMINRRFYAEKSCSNATPVISRIDLEAIRAIAREFVALRGARRSRSAIVPQDKRQFVASVRFGDYWLKERDIAEALSDSIDGRPITTLKPGVKLSYDIHEQLQMTIDCWGPEVSGELLHKYGYLAGETYIFQFLYDGTKWVKQCFDLDGVI